MTDVMTTTLAGLQANASRFATAAENIASMRGDLAGEMVSETQASAGFRANLATFRAAHDMMGALLDIMT